MPIRLRMMEMRPVCYADKSCVNAAGVPLLVYGVMLVLFIIFLPKGVVGASVDFWKARGNIGAQTRGKAGAEKI